MALTWERLLHSSHVPYRSLAPHPFQGTGGPRTAGYKAIPGASPDALQATGALARFSTAGHTDSAEYFVYRRYQALQPSRQCISVPYGYIPVPNDAASGYLQVNELLMHLAGGVDVWIGCKAVLFPRSRWALTSSSPSSSLAGCRALAAVIRSKAATFHGFRDGDWVPNAIVTNLHSLSHRYQ